jgi:hypothetical protein
MFPVPGSLDAGQARAGTVDGQHQRVSPGPVPDPGRPRPAARGHVLSVAVPDRARVVQTGGTERLGVAGWTSRTATGGRRIRSRPPAWRGPLPGERSGRGEAVASVAGGVLSVLARVDGPLVIGPAPAAESERDGPIKARAPLRDRVNTLAGHHRVQVGDDSPAIVAEAARSGWDAVLTRRTGEGPVEEYPGDPIR